ncbi:MAG TPA: hypothetical protein VKR06_02235 [Ktedonosporobacter sp.]|nr:hypothetical protein [Ktedonosporobacter sp.]
MQPQYPGQSQPQAPYGQIPPVAPAPRKRRRWPWILGIIAGVIILACVGGTIAIVLVVNNSPSKTAAQHYYDAIKSQDYATAFSYLDPTMTLTIQGQQQQITSQTFTQAAQGYDTDKGKVSAYSITGVNLNSSTSTGNTADITVQVTRNGAPYDVHLRLQQQGNDWKIVSFDSL